MKPNRKEKNEEEKRIEEKEKVNRERNKWERQGKNNKRGKIIFLVKEKEERKERNGNEKNKMPHLFFSLFG